jgi:hypothetical protein
MSRVFRTNWLLGWCGLLCLALQPAQMAQTAPLQDAVPAATTFHRMEGTDTATGIRWVRLLLSLPSAGDPERAPRFTAECDDVKGKHQLLWFVSFGGIDDPGFVAPFDAGQNQAFAPQYPGVDLKMDFEGYTRQKPFTRSWAVMPGGEYRYRNPGAFSPNMDSPRYFMSFLNALPGLRIVHAKPAKGDPGELFFPTKSLLDELNKTPICAP